jgi:hypothetical protein
MLVLSGTDFPASASAVAAAVSGGLGMFLQLPAGGQVVELTGEYPHFSLAQINLTGAASAADRLPPEPRGTGKVVPGFDAARLEVSAQPIRLRGSPLALSLTADRVTFEYDRDAEGRPVLLVREAANGHFNASITKADLESLILAAAREATADHGITISEATLQWTQLDRRSAGLAVSVVGRKLVKVQITVVGRLTIDDAMVARMTNLECNGSGLIATLACATIRPKLQLVERLSFNLNSLAGGQVQLRDVQVTVGDALDVQARFGA